MVRTGKAEVGLDDVVITPFALARGALERWRLAVALPLVAAAAAALSAIVFREYTARSRFVPQTARSDVSRLAGLAAQMGFAVGGGGPAESPDFYVDLVGSGEVLRPAVQRELRFAARPGGDTLSGTWLDLLGIQGDSPEERVQNGIDALRVSLSAGASLKSGIVTLRTTAPTAGLAEAINLAILDLLATFDRERRQAGARAERVFVEDRLAGAKAELHDAEAALATFLDHNRRPDAPRLTMEMERLQRQVALRQQVYAALAQAHEQASLEEVRNTPVITIIDRPEGSARRGRGVLVLGGLGFLFGAALALGIIASLVWLEKRSDTPDALDPAHTLRPWNRSPVQREAAS